MWNRKKKTKLKFVEMESRMVDARGEEVGGGKGDILVKGYKRLVRK